MRLNNETVLIIGSATAIVIFVLSVRTDPYYGLLGGVLWILLSLAYWNGSGYLFVTDNEQRGV
jgi:thiamine transporter ThiT